MGKKDKAADICAQLQDAVKGIRYPGAGGERSYPLAVLKPWKRSMLAISKAELLRHFGLASGVLVEEVSVEYFFGDLPNKRSDWKTLYDLLLMELSNTQVFRVGETIIRVYIIGRGPTDEWLGIRTKVVET